MPPTSALEMPLYNLNAIFGVSKRVKNLGHGRIVSSTRRR